MRCINHLLQVKQRLRTVTTAATSGTRPSQSVSLVRARLGPVKAVKASNGALVGPVDANSLRVVDTELHVEAEQSYLAVSDPNMSSTASSHHMGAACE